MSQIIGRISSRIESDEITESQQVRCTVTARTTAAARPHKVFRHLMGVRNSNKYELSHFKTQLFNKQQKIKSPHTPFFFTLYLMSATASPHASGTKGHFGPQWNIMVFLSLGHNSVTKAHPHQQGSWTWI